MVKYFSGMVLPGILAFTIKERSQINQKPYDYNIKQIPLSIYLVKFSLIIK